MRKESLALLLCLAPAAPAIAQTPVARCGARSAVAPELTRYDALVPGSRHRVVVRYDAATRTWMPATQLAMPLHHASALVFSGYTFPAQPADGATLALVVVAVARDFVERDASTHTWFFSYRV